MSWKDGYREDKQAKLETRISPETKRDFFLVAEILDTNVTHLIRMLVEHTIEQYQEELEALKK